MSSKPYSQEERINTEKKETIFFIPPTRRTPSVHFRRSEGYLEISGRSIPNRANDFYFPIMRKVEEYIQDPCDQTTLVFNLEYVDSSSSKFLLALILRMKKVTPSKQLTINWQFADDDEDIFELGKTFSSMTGCEFKFNPLE
jgi:hypothetical protein